MNGGYDALTGNELDAARLAAYDYSYAYECRLYDNLPYERTYELCNENTVCMFSGNVIKAQNINMQDAYVVDNHDAQFLAKLEDARLESSVVADQDFTVISEEPQEDDIASSLMSEYVPRDEVQMQGDTVSSAD